MKTYNFFTAASANYKDQLKLICLGMKRFKKPDVKYVYHIMFQTDRINLFQQFFKQFNSDDFEVDVFDFSRTKVKQITNRKNIVSMQKCLAPSIFPQLDQVLWLDADIIIAKEGIEQLFEIELGNFYVAAAYDVQIQYNEKREKEVCHVQNYFNSGVMMLNLKIIRQDGLDKVLEQDCKNYPVNSSLNDQPIFNLRFKQNVLWVSPIFNNITYGAAIKHVSSYNDFVKQYGCQKASDLNKDTIIFHFAGVCKPWKDYNRIYFPFKKDIDVIYNQVKKQLEG